MIQENTDIGEKFDDALKRALYGTIVTDDDDGEDDEHEDDDV